MKFIFELNEIVSLKELTKRIKTEYIRFIWQFCDGKVSNLIKLLKTKHKTGLYKILFPERYL